MVAPGGMLTLAKRSPMTVDWLPLSPMSRRSATRLIGPPGPSGLGRIVDRGADGEGQCGDSGTADACSLGASG